MNDQEPDINPEDQNQSNDENQPGEITPLINPVGAAFIGLIGAFILYQFFGAALVALIFGFNTAEAPVDGLRLLTSAGQILFILLPALIFAKWFYEDVTSVIRFRLADPVGIILFSLGVLILRSMLQSFISIQNYFFFRLAENYEFINSIKVSFDKLNEFVEKTYGNLLTIHSVLEGVFVVIVVAVVPAVCEEVMFRGFIQKSFELKLKPFWAIVITAIFFGLNHFNPYGMVALISLGVYFGYAAYISNSIMIPVILHFINNFAAVMIYFILGDDELINSVKESEPELLPSVIAFGVLLFLFSSVMVLISKHYKKKT
ncbi:MAG: CPBP family intramembrane metalloprotease [Ignavibacteriales bacterium]|nr:MAG: CPBP family intramembrane metalloprotease [Ignavibacteriales bacterium]